MTLRLTKRFTFEMAHALPTYPGKCSNLHGHSYKLYVTVEGCPQRQPGTADDGMVIDFGTLKAIVQQHLVDPFDHALVLPADPGTPRDSAALGGFAAKIVWVDFLPTTENLLLHFADILRHAIPAGTRLYSLKLYETETSCAELIL